jgi:3-oxoacyl-[acyl-carrier-protein] synthase-3
MQPRSARIAGWGYHVPERILTNADLERLVDTSDEWIQTRTGIRERRIAAPGESTATIASVAARRALAVAGVDSAEVDMILVATITPDYQFPSTAALVKEAIGSAGAAAMDVAAACSGFVYALTSAHAYVSSGMYRNVLVIGAEVLSRVLDFTDRNTCVLFGDGAGAVLVQASDQPGGGLLGFELTVDPAGAYKIWIPAGGNRNPPTPDTMARHGHYLRMDGRETYRYATRTLARSALTAIERAGLTPDDISLFVPHQANIRIIESVAKQLGLAMERVYVNVDRYGNTSAASVPIALSEAVERGRVRPGDRLVFVAFGSGYTSGAAVLEWTADPALSSRGASVGPDVTIHAPDDWTRDDPTPPALVPFFREREGAAAGREADAATGLDAAGGSAHARGAAAPADGDAGAPAAREAVGTAITAD